MPTLFNLVSPGARGIIRNPEWQYVRDGLQRNLSTVVNYYQTHTMAVESSHFLVKLLTAITTPQSQPLYRYWDNVDSSALNVAMALKMTSSLQKGQLFPGTFYGPGNSEILIANTDAFDLVRSHKQWRYLTPVKVLRHPRSDLGLNLPDGTKTGTETGLVVLSINIPMLAIQYRAFRQYEASVSDDYTNQRSIMQFIHMFVLPGILFSHLDVAVFNRIQNLLDGAPLGESTKAHPFYLTDYRKQCNRLQTEILRNVGQRGRDFGSILQTVQLVTKENAEALTELPDIAATRQVLWALAIATLPVVRFLFHVGEDPGVRNRNEVNRITRSVLAYKTDNLMKVSLPRNEYETVQDELRGIIEGSRDPSAIKVGV